MVLTAAVLHLEQIDSTESLFLVPNEHDEENICKAFNTYFCMNACDLLSTGCLELTTGTTSGIFTVTHFHFQSLMWMLLKTRSVPLVVIKISKNVFEFYWYDFISN